MCSLVGVREEKKLYKYFNGLYKRLYEIHNSFSPTPSSCVLVTRYTHFFSQFFLSPFTSFASTCSAWYWFGYFIMSFWWYDLSSKQHLSVPDIGALVIGVRIKFIIIYVQHFAKVNAMRGDAMELRSVIWILLLVKMIRLRPTIRCTRMQRNQKNAPRCDHRVSKQWPRLK